MPSSNHRERIGARKIRSPRHLADRFLARIDQVWIFLPFHRIRPNSEHPILRLKRHLDPARHMIRNQRRHANPKVHIEPIAQFARNPPDNAFALVDIFRRLIHRPRSRSLSRTTLNRPPPRRTVILNEILLRQQRSETAVEGPLHSKTHPNIAARFPTLSAQSCARSAARITLLEKSASHKSKAYGSDPRPSLP